MPQEDDPRSSAEGSASQPEEPEELANLSFGELTIDEDFRRLQLYDAARKYAKLGWRVIPLCWYIEDRPGCGYGPHNAHAPCHSPGKRALQMDWPNQGSNDPERASRWWRAMKLNALDSTDWHPFASIGIVLGEGSGIFAMDIDPAHGGEEKLAELERLNGDLPLTRIHKTGGDGAHYIFAWPGFRVHNLKPWGVDAGIDIKGDNGYIVVPPSRSHKGDYAVSEQMENIDPVHAPEWILSRLRREAEEQTGRILITPEAIPNKVISKYVESACKGEIYALTNAPRGARNDQLFASARSLGSLAAHNLLTKAEVREMLRQACFANGYIADDGVGAFDASFLSGWNTGMSHPRELASIGAIRDHEWPRLARNEYGLAERLVVYYGDYLRWIESWDAWAVYAGGVWIRRARDSAASFVYKMIKMLPVTEGPRYDDEPTANGDDSPRDQFMEWCLKVQKDSTTTATWRVSRYIVSMNASPEEFDTHPELLNVANGVVDLRTGQLQPHNPELMISMRSPVLYDKDAKCPRWLKFLAQVQPEAAVRAYLQCVAGYGATGETNAQVFFLHHGSGANGKSVFHNVVGSVLGNYRQQVPVETLMDNSLDRIPNDVARMMGRRYLLATETKAGKFLDEPKIKQLTGGDNVAARFMRGEYFEFRMQGKIHLATNHLPSMSNDAAMWRRIRLITWPVVIPEEQRDADLEATLIREEGSGILAWIVRGAQQWYERGGGLAGLVEPSEVALAKKDYAHAEDIYEQWIEQRCDVDLSRMLATVGSFTSVLYPDFQSWCREQGLVRIDHSKTFTNQLKKKGYVHQSEPGHRYSFSQLTLRSHIV